MIQTISERCIAMLYGKTINQCTIVLTHNCNLRCNFCYAKSAGYKESDRISIKNLKEIVGFCRDAKVKYLVFTGGEPLLYPNLVDVVRYIKASTPSISVAIPTNGVLLKDLDYCKKLIESGVEYFDISIKGRNSDEWYKATGHDGSSSQLIAIHNLSTLPVEFTCSMVITPENVHTFCDSIRVARDNGAKQFSFTFLIDNTDSEEKGEEYLENHNPFALIAAFVSQIEKLNAITEEWWIEYSFPLCAYSKEQLTLLEGKLASPCQIHMCNAVTFNTRMELLPCDMYIQQSIGKLGEDFISYYDYIKFSEKPLFRNIMDPLRRLPSSNCESCEYLESCYGGCPVLWKNYSYDELMVFKKRSHA